MSNQQTMVIIVNSTNLATCLLAVVALSGCTVNVDADGKDGGGGKDGVRTYGSFSSVTNRSDADIELIQANGDLKPGDIKIVCSGGLDADVDTNVDGSGNLVIQFASDVASVLGCSISVVSDGVTVITDDGDGDIVCGHRLDEVVDIEVKGNGSVFLGTVDADVLNILITGTGALDVDNVVAGTVNLDLRGTGDATLAGTTDDADLLISGSGSLLARDLTVADTLDAVLNGSGDGAITVNGTVNADVTGPAQLDIYGAATAGVIVESDGGLVIFH